MNATIAVEGLEFYAYHGCFEEEQIVGTYFIVHVWIDADVETAANTDDINATISYLDVYQLVKAEMQINSKLLENVAFRIINAIYNKFSDAIKVTVKVSKLNPPLGGKLSNASVTLTK